MLEGVPLERGQTACDGDEDSQYFNCADSVVARANSGSDDNAADVRGRVGRASLAQSGGKASRWDPQVIA